jgi:rhodanese-related sulfurtransferase
MGFWDFAKPVDINAKLAEARSIHGALIIDVREPREYEYGHIPGALNLPVNFLGTIRTTLKGWLPEKHTLQTPLYLYCVSGARSKKAKGILKAMGFELVENMGGIGRYTGQFEKGPMPEAPIADAAPATSAPAPAESAPADTSAAPTAPAPADTPVAAPTEPAPATTTPAASAELTTPAPGLDDLEGPVTDPRVDALTAETIAELQGGDVTVKTFPNEDAAKVYLMGKVTGGQLDMQRGLLLYTPAGAEIILLDE